jgi:hypothetical protein
MNVEQEQEYVEPTRSGRRLLIVSLLFAVGAAAAAPFVVVQFRQQLQTMKVCEIIEWLQVLLFGIPVGALVMSIPLLWIGLRVLQHDRIPLPNSMVWRRTKVIRGSAARWRAWGVISCAGAIALCGLYGLVMASHYGTALHSDFNCSAS